MQHKLILVIVLTAVGISGASIASAQTTGENNASDVPQEQLFLAATVTLDQATQIALKEVPGKLAAIGFNDENGMGVYEATVVGANGQASIVKIDAGTGTVLAKGLASLIGDEGQGEQVGGGDQENGGQENGGQENGGQENGENDQG